MNAAGPGSALPDVLVSCSSAASDRGGVAGVVNPPGFPWVERNLASADRVQEWKRWWGDWKDEDVGDDDAEVLSEVK